MHRSSLRFLCGVLATAIACTAALLLAGTLYRWSVTGWWLLSMFWSELLAFLLAGLFAGAVLALLVALAQKIAFVRQLGPTLQAIAIALFFPVLPLIWGNYPGAIAAALAGLVTAFFWSGLGHGRGSRRWWAALAAFATAAGAVAVLPLMAYERESAQTEPPPSILGDFITAGAMHEGELWLAGGRGKLVSFRPADARATRRAERGIAAIQRDGETLWVLMVTSDGAPDWQSAGQFRLARHRGGAWTQSAPLRFAVGERPAAVIPVAGGAVVLGPKQLHRYDVAGSAWSTRALSQPIYPLEQVSAVLAGPDIAYIGRNLGEFGGGLTRVALDTGAVQTIEAPAAQEICTALLDSGCTPVTGVIVDPARPGCVIASIGLRHFMEDGRLIRVCGNKIELMMEKTMMPIGERIQRALGGKTIFPDEMEGFFGLAADSRGYWAVSSRAIYRVEGNHVTRHAMPAMTRRSGILMSTALPGVIVFATGSNGQFSLSGLTPMIAASE